MNGKIILGLVLLVALAQATGQRLLTESCTTYGKYKCKSENNDCIWNNKNEICHDPKSCGDYIYKQYCENQEECEWKGGAQECREIETPKPETVFFDYENAQWYQDLMAIEDNEVIELTQSDFESGTFRITTSGRYKLMEDIIFEPQTEHMYPKFHDPAYPINNYYLGFFAAITVEAKDVMIDLNEYTISMSDKFWLWQRFFNIIELNDRVFVINEGVGSLNYQENDKFQFECEECDATVGLPKSAERVVICNGVLGQSSHNGIHGNNVNNIVIKDLTIQDFEVAGIQINGGDYIAIESVSVGPSHHEVVATHRLNTAIVLHRFTQIIIPYGFAHINLEHLLQEEISFADRPDISYTIEEVFGTLSTRLTAWINAVLAGDETDHEDDKLFLNDFGLPDGSAMYGIFLHRIGAGVEAFAAQDENYYGPEHFNVNINNVKITDLSLNTVMVPTLAMGDGEILQGPARESIEFLSLIDRPMRSVPLATYKGNIIMDATIAMNSLSSLFYTNYILDSDCGNFGSNLTSNFANCHFEKINPDFTGRDTGMLQKKYFGGLKISQAFYDWATIPGSRLESLLARQPKLVERRQTQHWILCNRDALFHVNKGIAALRIEFMGNISVSNVNIERLYNSADRNFWICDRKYVLNSNMETIMASGGTNGGADIRAITFGSSEGFEVKNVKVDELESLEGAVIGVEVTADVNDRSDWDAPEVAFNLGEITLGSMKAGAGELVIPTSSSQLAQPGGVEVDASPEFHNEYDMPKKMFSFGRYDNNNAWSSCKGDDPESLERCRQILQMTDEELEYEQASYFEFLYHQFGIEVEDDIAWYESKVIYNGTYQIGGLFPSAYQKVYECDREGCETMTEDEFIYDVTWWSQMIDEGIIYHGTFGGPEGWAAKKHDLICMGKYRLPIKEDNAYDTVTFYSECPLRNVKVYESNTDVNDDDFFMYGEEIADEDGNIINKIQDQYMTNCVIESENFGIGRTVGQNWGNTTTQGHYVNMIFDDRINKVSDLRPITQENVDSLVELGFPAAGSIALPKLMFQVLADGKSGAALPLSGHGVHPLTKGFHRLHEAGVYYLKRWPGLDDDGIKAFRTEALDHFKEYVGLANIVDSYYEDPLENQLDLGTGNFIAPYTVTESANFRVLAGSKETDLYCTGGRIHEGGFQLSVGRAGISTNMGFYEYGTMMLYGFYVIECEEKLEVIKFWDRNPIPPNHMIHFDMNQYVVHEEYGTGSSSGLKQVLNQRRGGVMWDNRMQFVWNDDKYMP